MPGSQRGFTLIELIVVIILVGIISVTAASRFSGMSSISSPVYRDQLISSMRLTQMRAMQTRDNCHRWLLGNTKARQVDISQATCNTSTFPGKATFWDDQTAIDVGNKLNARFTITADGAPQTLPYALDFDSFGRIQKCSDGCRVTVSGSDTLAICIESEGYIHAC
ncbi:prepilin-type N-terminal cleavage/methylation domain-containing protein [Photobacterium sp. J15]|uniref:prepilin-type N-terminal cleavage/methylation domain-containing protein n=1 Tax=Photobacterium sp. J15 TaxID=265901 RepID=UPI0007E44D1D|nr:prepilin-type N-terminal cleavage/methylation domain-containing protein [Photobacterium sp. J15]